MKSQKQNFVGKIINLFLNILIVIFGIILLISIYTSVQTKILGNAYANFYGYSIFEVQTGSMADTINAGDCIIVKLTNKVKLNDIITYKLGNEYITHRVIEVYNKSYITKGDANSGKDSPINQNQIVGKVVDVWSNFGIIRKTIFNPSVLIALIITLFLFDFALKKNKKGEAKTISNKEENNYLFLNGIAKKIAPLFSLIIQKSTLLLNAIGKKLSKIKELKSNGKYIKDDGHITNVNKGYLENYKKANGLDKLKDLPKKVDTEDYYKDEDDLDKTSLYRVIPADATDVDSKFKDAPKKAEVEEYYKDEDELDKTSLYRIIPVDATEVDNTLLEIANNEIKEGNQKDNNQVVKPVPKQEEKQVIEDEEDDDDSLTKINLNLLQSKHGQRKGKNIIDSVMLVKKEELNKLIEILVKDNKDYISETTIKNVFISTYIDVKYYNCYADRDIENDGKNSISKIEKAIKETAIEKFINNHSKNEKYNGTVDIYSKSFILIANLEQARDSITDPKVKNEFYKRELKKYAKDWNSKKIDDVISEIMSVQRECSDTLEAFLKKLETNMFELKLNKLPTKKNMYGLELKHNITFSKVYSDYIIDKTYTEGIIAEDKLVVLLTLLSVQLVKDMTSSNFHQKYVLHVPVSLYSKEKKLEKLLNMIDDKYARDNVIILITFEDLINNTTATQKVRKMGYKFALLFNKETLVEEKHRGNIYIADYIFINKKIVNIVKIKPYIPEELLNSIIYEDVAEKVGDLGSE